MEEDIKNFRRQMKLCSITAWLFTGIFYFIGAFSKDGELVIVPITAIIYTFIWIKTNRQIKDNYPD